MPPEIDPLSAVTIEHTDRDTWVVRRVRRTKTPPAIIVAPLTDKEARRAFCRDTRQEAFEAAVSSSQAYPLPEE